MLCHSMLDELPWQHNIRRIILRYAESGHSVGTALKSLALASKAMHELVHGTCLAEHSSAPATPMQRLESGYVPLTVEAIAGRYSYERLLDRLLEPGPTSYAMPRRISWVSVLLESFQGRGRWLSDFIGLVGRIDGVDPAGAAFDTSLEAAEGMLAWLSDAANLERACPGRRGRVDLVRTLGHMVCSPRSQCYPWRPWEARFLLRTTLMVSGTVSSSSQDGGGDGEGDGRATTEMDLTQSLINLVDRTDAAEGKAAWFARVMGGGTFAPEVVEQVEAFAKDQWERSEKGQERGRERGREGERSEFLRENPGRCGCDTKTGGFCRNRASTVGGTCRLPSHTRSG